MAFHLWLSLVSICVLGALSPGPSLALVIRNTIWGGAEQGIKTAISHGLGVALYALITAAGLGVLIVNSPFLFTFVQYAGATFLVYLAIKSLISAFKSSGGIPENSEQPKAINGWRDGFLIAFLNPKLAIFFLALFSQFVDANLHWQQLFIMTSTVGGIDALWYCLVAYGFSRGNLIEKLKTKGHIIDGITGLVLLALAARVVV